MRATFVEANDEIVEVPWTQIEGEKQNKDGSWMFRLVGGPLHDITIRVYPPCDRIVFPPRNTTEGEGVVYEINPPLNRKNQWVYVHNPTGDTGPMPIVKTIARKVEKLGR